MSSPDPDRNFSNYTDAINNLGLTTHSKAGEPAETKGPLYLNQDGSAGVLAPSDIKPQRTESQNKFSNKTGKKYSKNGG